MAQKRPNEVQSPQLKWRKNDLTQFSQLSRRESSTQCWLVTRVFSARDDRGNSSEMYSWLLMQQMRMEFVHESNIRLSWFGDASPLVASDATGLLGHTHQSEDSLNALASPYRFDRRHGDWNLLPRWTRRSESYVTNPNGSRPLIKPLNCAAIV